MQYKITGELMPALDITLTQGEQIYTQSGGMAWMDPSIKMDTNMKGGLMKGLGRMFTGESLFMVTYSCTAGQGTITFVPTMPGTILPFDVTNTHIICQKSAFLCAEPNVTLDVVFTKKLMAGMFGGEGFMLQKISGSGMVFLEASGLILERTLAPGEVILVDTGHVVAFEQQVNYEVQTVKGFTNVFFGGEGLFLTKLTGPGKVYLQTMTVQSLAEKIIPFIPAKS